MGNASTTKRNDPCTVVTVEATKVENWEFGPNSKGTLQAKVQRSWSPVDCLGDDTGERLAEEICRQLRIGWRSFDQKAEMVAISLPGTLKEAASIRSSSRLNIRSQLDLAAIVEDELGVKCRLFHDLECMAVAELHNRVVEADRGDSLAFVFVDEGVGSKFIIGHQVYVGGGVAGTLGRMIVEPDGTFFPPFKSRGPLEAYVARPAVSRQMVEAFLAHSGKRPLESNVDQDSRFRRALQSALEDPESISIAIMQEGLASADPIAEQVLDVAARFLGYALSAVVATFSPHRIALAGDMVTELGEFAERAKSYAQLYLWPLAWNQTTIDIVGNARRIQPSGARYLMVKNEA